MKRFASSIEGLFTIAAVALLLINWCGCVNAINVAIASSNGLGELLDSSAPVLETKCTRAYQAIPQLEQDKRAAEVRRLDEVCLPLALAYDSARATHVATIAAILAAQAAEHGKRPDAARMLALGAQAVSAAEALAASVQAVSQARP